MPSPAASGELSSSAVRAPEPSLSRDAVAGATDDAVRGRGRWWLAAVAALAAAAAVIAFQSTRRGEPPAPVAGGSSVAAKVEAEIAKADRRISEGRLVAEGGDDALDHLLAARALDPANPGVRERLHAIADKYQQLADQALAAASLTEAAAELQTVVSAEPDNAAAVAKMREVEDMILSKQRASGPRHE